ncbi:hypothetical protein [Gephyromycinifex aptenodytis]|uniref:hypothetical protein n=1 Tax=Gephyromycinifex aptenodytis TaxID=2716227 RepID=UPI001447C02F|nr:hypothetical protein [Gephyromycinifex aptenodytis]
MSPTADHSTNSTTPALSTADAGTTSTARKSAAKKSAAQKQTATKRQAAKKTSAASQNAAKKQASKRTAAAKTPAKQRTAAPAQLATSARVKVHELSQEAETHAGKLAVEARRTALDSGFAMLGITDLAIERLRLMQQQMEELRAELTSRSVVGEFKRISGRVVSLPNDVISSGLETAEKAEEQFDNLAARGRNLVERVSHDEAVAELFDQGRATVSRGKSLVTVTRKGAKKSTEAAQDALTAVEADVVETVGEAIDRVEQEVSSGAQTTAASAKAATKRAATTARTRAAATKSQAKGLATSASKTLEAAAQASEHLASQVGQPENATAPTSPVGRSREIRRRVWGLWRGRRCPARMSRRGFRSGRRLPRVRCWGRRSARTGCTGGT